MNPLIPPKKNLIDLIILSVISLIIFFLVRDFDFLALFIFGFIWNWTASIDQSVILQNRRYRFSMLRVVVYLQELVQKPVARLPEYFKVIFKILPAGFFWLVVIYLNESQMPWWAVFIGSCVFEFVYIAQAVFLKAKSRT